MPALVLGPMLRYVDEEVATLWVQTDAACEAEILGAVSEILTSLGFILAPTGEPRIARTAAR